MKHLDSEQSQLVVDWAVRTGAVLYTVYNVMRDTDEITLDHIHEYLELILDDAPECVTAPIISLAEASYAEAVEEEEQIQEFRKELDEL